MECRYCGKEIEENKDEGCIEMNGMCRECFGQAIGEERTISKHTPGPWRVYQEWVHPCFDHQGQEKTNGDTAICEPLGPNKWANARLIAAAPEMYEALKKAEQFIANGIELGYIRLPIDDCPDPALDTLGILREALAKAEGRE